MEINTIIFDLGGVLIDWNPDYLYKKLIPIEAERQWFFANICTSEWNEEQDGGRKIAAANKLLIDRYPEFQLLIEAYYSRWTEMLGGDIPETVKILNQIKQSGKYKIYALTNWSAETFPIALGIFDFLHWFDGRLVSGVENTRKPFPEFYELLLTRFNIDRNTALFIDDNKRNVDAAEALGIKCIHFTTPHQLIYEMKELNILAK
jgi:2-haloacid dehalogenase